MLVASSLSFTVLTTTHCSKLFSYKTCEKLLQQAKWQSFCIQYTRNLKVLFTKDVVSFEQVGPGPEVIKHFSCSTQLSMEFFLLITVKMPTIFGILTVMSGKNSILGLSERKKDEFLDFFYT